MQIKRGFTLIEVLIAAGILFMVAGAVAGLTNTIVQGTSQTADNTETNRWASEGIELVTKIRNDSVAKGGEQVNGEKVWFEPAISADNYGWYKFNQSGQLEKLNQQNSISFDTLTTIEDYAEKITSVSSGLSGYRLICIEAYAANSVTNDQKIDCNNKTNLVATNTSNISDGDRQISYTNCAPDDTYCANIIGSLNTNNPTSVQYLSLPGNALRVRSVIVWQDREEFRTAQMSTVLTNWKGFEQN